MPGERPTRAPEPGLRTPEAGAEIRLRLAELNVDHVEPPVEMLPPLRSQEPFGDGRRGLRGYLCDQLASLPSIGAGPLRTRGLVGVGIRDAGQRRAGGVAREEIGAIGCELGDPAEQRPRGDPEHAGEDPPHRRVADVDAAVGPRIYGGPRLLPADQRG